MMWTLEWNASRLDEFFEDGFGLRRFLASGNVTRADNHTMREHGKNEPLEIIRQAVIAAFEETRAPALHDAA